MRKTRMDDYKEETLKLPASLLASLEDLCYKKDTQFIQSVSRILKINPLDIRKRIFGLLGKTTVVLSSHTPYWANRQCAAMTVGAFWKRCGMVAEADGCCWAHRHKGILRYDDASFKSMEKLKPFRLDDEIVWVSQNGSVRNESGVLLKEWTIDISNGHAECSVGKCTDDMANKSS